MFAEQYLLLTPVVDKKGAWGGIWLHGDGEVGALAEKIRSAMPQLNIYQTGDAALATGIQSAAQMSTAVAGGAEALAGPYVSHPPVVAASKQDSGRAVLLRLLTLLTQDADTAEIEQIFKHDPGLSFHLLRLVNSAGMGLTRQISTFNQAIMLLGRRQLQRWVQLLLYANKNDGGDSPLLVFAAMRGYLMEQLAVLHGCDAAARELAFMTGIFSLLDSLLGMNMAELSKSIQLPESVHMALVERQGELGEMLSWVENVHAGNVSPSPVAGAGETSSSIQLDTLSWALNVGAGAA